MNMDAFEKELRLHGKRVKAAMVSPCTEEMEVLTSSMKYSNEKSRGRVKYGSRKLAAIVAIAALLALAGTALAAGGDWRGWLSFPAEKYDSMPSGNKLENEIDYAAVLIESFENGYDFKHGYTVDNEIIDDIGDVKDNFKSVMFEYEKDGDIVYFSQEKTEAEIDVKGEQVDSISGTDVYYYSYVNKIVPEDYELSEEEKSARESGEIIFSWGSDEVKLTEVRSLQWEKNGINYMLLQIGGLLDCEELVGMARQILDVH